MKVLSSDTKHAHLGKPGSEFSPGFERRLRMIIKKIDLADKKILDFGTGEGVWLNQFAKIAGSDNVFGSDIDAASIEKAKGQFKGPSENIKVAAGENLPFPSEYFDVVFSNEVLEHVEDDKQAVNEMLRVLKPGGKIVLFTPNRGWPFETHGAFIRGKYYWGNVPFLPWMPKSIRVKFAPHVRNYSNVELLKLFPKESTRIVQHKHIFPGFDGMVRRLRFIGRVIKKVFHLLEKTPLHYFGISHFLILEKF